MLSSQKTNSCYSSRPPFYRLRAPELEQPNFNPFSIPTKSLVQYEGRHQIARNFNNSTSHQTQCSYCRHLLRIGRALYSGLFFFRGFGAFSTKSDVSGCVSRPSHLTSHHQLSLITNCQVRHVCRSLKLFKVCILVRLALYFPLLHRFVSCISVLDFFPLTSHLCLVLAISGGLYRGRIQERQLTFSLARGTILPILISLGLDCKKLAA